jgi:uncharacterized protein involved in type VI secretion and phage assembly
MPESPLVGSDGVVNFAIECNGRAIDDAVQVPILKVRHALSQVASARIELMGGNAPTQDWPVADAATFAPGAAIRISAGYGANAAETIFDGIVVRLGMRIDADGSSRVIVECQHRAMALTVGRRNRVFVDKTDSQAIEELVAEHGLTATVETTSVRHHELVQYGATDWEFLCARAKANGLCVMTTDNGLHVKRPDTTPTPALSVTRGFDLMAFRADMQAATASWADVRGQMTFIGCAKAWPAEFIQLTGVGQHCSGPVRITAVEHEISHGHWTTKAEFDRPANPVAQHADVNAPSAHGTLSGIGGLHVGVVNQLEPDPTGEVRIQIRLSMLEAAPGSGGLLWARLAQWQAGAGFGAFFVPEVGDEVVVGFFNEDPNHPVVLGSLYSTKRQPPADRARASRFKSFTTRSGHRFEFDDEDKVVTLTTPAGNRVVLSDKDQSVWLIDENQNKLTLDSSGIRLEAPKDVRINAQGAITLEAVGAINLSSKNDIKSSGLNVACEAQAGFVGKGNASAELSAAGQTTVKGAMVLIN